MENNENGIIEDVLNIEPYRFEPLNALDNNQETSGSDSTSDSDTEENDVNVERIGNTLWCTCGHCAAMTTGRESICCQENQLVCERLEDAELECMTLHEGFEGNCINRYVIETSLYAYIQEVSPIDDEEPPHKTYRYIAYRNFTRFVYHRLRKHERKVIPSCCVKKIRNAFPSQEYCGFKYARP